MQKASAKLRVYVWDKVFCEYNCGHVVVLAESVQQAMELVVAEDAAPSQEDAAIELFKKFQLDPAGFSANNFVSELWQTLWSDQPTGYPIDQPNVFICNGSA